MEHGIWNCFPTFGDPIVTTSGRFWVKIFFPKYERKSFMNEAT